MLKLTSVIMGMLAAASVAQPSLAATTASSFANPVVPRPADNLQAQLIIKIGDTSSSRDSDRYRSERERERYERERWEAKRRRYYERERRYEKARERYEDRHDDDYKH